ncbi:MAG: LysE family transporter [Alphaproteobacteria bacterium]
MAIEAWLAYVVAATALLLVPGPTVLLVVTYALSAGRRSALYTVIGVTLGDIAAIAMSMAGLGALLAASATAFTALKWVGAAYLVYLGIRLWRAPASLDDKVEGAAGSSARAMLAHAFVVTALNPKSIVFFVAFLPQFINPHAPVLGQMTLLGATFVVLATVIVTGYALLASGARERIRRPSVLRWMNRAGGGALIAAGVLTVVWRRAT